MSRVYRQPHPERTVFYSLLFHYFESFLLEYENRFERHFGHLRPIIQEVVDKYLDCGNPHCGFACIRFPDCGEEWLLMFSCKTRGSCPSCHAKRREEWGEWMRERLILNTPHRQVVFTIPKMLRTFFKFNRSLLSDGLYANAHRGKMRKKGSVPLCPLIIEDEDPFIPSKGWAEMIKKVYEIDPLICPKCGGTMRIVSFIEDHKVIDKIIKHLNLTFKAARPPSPQAQLSMAAEELSEYI